MALFLRNKIWPTCCKVTPPPTLAAVQEATDKLFMSPDTTDILRELDTALRSKKALIP